MSTLTRLPSEIITLRDGARLTIRPIQPDDAPRLQAFHARLSPESIYLRFLSPHPVLSASEAEQFTNVDYQSRLAFVATRLEGQEESIVGVARYDVLGPSRPGAAEAAIVVEDDYQGRGVGTRLADCLVAYARDHGIRTIVAEVEAENERMLNFIRRSGLPATKKLENGVLEIQVKIA
jgi:RimJ/RimL family protein N-acetyltransferase